jgi:hypothetical protein
MDSFRAFCYFAQLNFSVRTPLNLNSRTFNMGNIASENLWLSIYSLDINSNQRA